MGTHTKSALRGLSRVVSIALFSASLVGCDAVLGLGSLKDGPAPDGGETSPPVGEGGSFEDAGPPPSGPDATPDTDTAPPPDDSGSDATLVDTGAEGTDASDGATGTACTSGEVRCSVNEVETCEANGQWGSAVPCPSATPACNAGVCGACTSGATECSSAGNGVQTCSASGAWGTAVPCGNSACVNGACAGSCAPGATQCTGDAGTTPETCATNGSWQTGATCAYVCSSGSCTGACTPGALTCSGQQPQKCDATGTWQSNGSPCPNVCSSGVCAGACTPGALTCNQLQPQKCDAAGAWDNNGAACPYVCSAGACSGSCAPGQVQCSTTSPTVPQTCNAAGAWVSGSACAYVCTSGACTGSCTPSATQCNATDTGVETCSAAGGWGAASTCPFVCSNGACGGVCTPGTTQCSTTTNGYETCGANGQWSTTVTACANSTCVSGSCAGSCAPGQTKGVTCGNCGTDTETCTSAGAWQTNTCTGQGACAPSATQTCEGTGTQTCSASCAWGGCSCPSGDSVCSATCVNEQSDANNCGACGHACGTGSTCTAGTCSPVTVCVGGTSLGSSGWEATFGLGLSGGEALWALSSTFSMCSTSASALGATATQIFTTVPPKSEISGIGFLPSGQVEVASSAQICLKGCTTTTTFDAYTEPANTTTAVTPAAGWTAGFTTDPSTGTNFFLTDTGLAVYDVDGSTAGTVQCLTTATAPYAPLIAAGGGHVVAYFYAGAQIIGGAVSASGCTDTALSSDITTVNALATDGTQFFYGDATSVNACPVSGCFASFAPLAANQGAVDGFAYDATNLYWIGTQGLVMCAKAGCNGAPTVIVPSTTAAPLDSTAGIAVDSATKAANVYYTQDSTLYRVAVP